MNYKILVQYDGTRYEGWQRQERTESTIQGKIEAVLSKMCGEEVQIQGAGRTDAGVHAKEQVANVHLKEQVDPQEVVEAAKKACCHDFISKLPDGYDTVIGEGGATLSGGEKQRISIARAIMKDAPIVILDEATANVDPENEKELMDAVDALTKEKTIIMIAHRLKTVRHADQIVVVDKGRIVQQGTHEQLMKQEGIYKRFVDARQQAVSWKLAH